jgi:tetratricopeptide (TPR) repeat protein
MLADAKPARTGNARRRVAPLLVMAVVVAAAPGPASVGTAAGSVDAAGELLREGKNEEAAAAYARVLEERPDEAAAIEGRVRALLALDRWRVALGEARAHQERLPRRPRVVSALGEALFRAGRLEEARMLLEPLEARGNAPPRALWTLSRIRGAAGHVEEAARLIERAIAIRPEAREMHLWAAEVAGTRAEALERLERYLAGSVGDDPDRIEAARDTARLYRELADRSVWEVEQQPERLELPLRQLWDDRGRTIGYVVEARVGDKRKPLRLLLDTGSPGLFVLERIARKRGFRTLSEGTTFGGGGTQRHRSGRGLFSTFDLGGLSYRDALASTTRMELDPRGRFHGILGISVFNGYRITIDLPRRRLVLEPGRERSAGSSYWICSAQLLVRAAAVGQAGGSGLFLLDTGASWSIASISFVEEVGGARLGQGATVRTFGGEVEGARFVGGLQLEFQGLTTREEIRAIDLSLRSRLTGVEISGYLGLDLLGRSTIVIDTVARRIQLRRRETD